MAGRVDEVDEEAITIGLLRHVAHVTVVQLVVQGNGTVVRGWGWGGLLVKSK